jgi:hypothetical protein
MISPRAVRVTLVIWTVSGHGPRTSNLSRGRPDDVGQFRSRWETNWVTRRLAEPLRAAVSGLCRISTETGNRAHGNVRNILRVQSGRQSQSRRPTP